MSRRIDEELPTMTAQQRFDANLRAVRLARRKSARSDEDRRAMALYTGWSDPAVRRLAFDDEGVPTVEFARLDPSREELRGARRSARGGRLAPAWLRRAAWDTLLRLGIDSAEARVLEVGCGAGHFIGAAPPELGEERVTVVEPDSLVRSVLAALRPSCDARSSALEDSDLPAHFDAVVGSVPSSDCSVPDGRLPPYCRTTAHEYAVCRAASLLRPGGVAVLVADRSVLDRRGDRARAWLCERVDLLAAWRLPLGALGEAAGTEATADVLVLRRLERDQPYRREEWVGTATVEADGRHGARFVDRVNAHFASHPHHVLGEWCQNPLVTQPDAAVRARPGAPPLEEAVAALVLALPLGVAVRPPDEPGGPRRGGGERDTAPTIESPDAGRTAAVTPAGPRDGRSSAATTQLTTPQELALGRLLRAARRALAEPGDEAARRLLRVTYGAYRAAWGAVREAEQPSHALHARTAERWWPTVACLEGVDGRPSRALAEAVVRGAERAVVDGVLDAAHALLDREGRFSPEAVAAELRRPIDLVERDLRGVAYQLGPGGEWQLAEQYLSGDVAAKLADARRWATADERFAGHVEALERALPTPVRLADGGLRASLGAGWVPASVYLDFLAHLFPAMDRAGGGVDLEWVEEDGRWVLGVTDPRVLGSVENVRSIGTDRVTAIELIECALEQRAPEVRDPIPGGGTARNVAATSAAQARLDEIRERWDRWLPQDPERVRLVEAAYNGRFNRAVPRPLGGQRLTFPGLALEYRCAPLRPRAHQISGAQRILEKNDPDDTAMLAHAPGLGKTMAALLGVFKRVQLGLTRRAVAVVPRGVLHQWRDAVRDLYPGLAERVLAPTDADFGSPARQRRFLSEAARGDAALTILTYEQFRAVPLRPETRAAYMQREVDELDRWLRARPDADDDRDDQSEATRAVARSLRARQRALAASAERDRERWEAVLAAGNGELAWEVWGCDLLLVDEFHSFKAIRAETRMEGISGLPRDDSRRAQDMALKLHYVTAPELFGQDRPSGKGVALTGTPITNSLAEAWVAMRLLQPRLLRRIGCWRFDSWASAFTAPVQVPEMDATGSWRLRTRLKFRNIPELLDLLGLCWDRVDPREAEGQRPEIVGGRMRVVECPGSEGLREYTRDLAARAEAVRRRLVPLEEDNMLRITHDGRVASLFNGEPTAAWPARRTKLDDVASEVWDLYCQSDPDRGAQLVFVDLFTPRGRSDVPTPLTPEERFAQEGVYGALRDRIVAAGVIPREVAYVHDAASEEERRALFESVNEGRVRVLIGSTQRMGLGVNVQRRAFAAHHVTVPWRPDWLDQANKRVDRDGNTMPSVHVVCYPTVGSYDAVLWQMIEQKADFISAINAGTYAGREADDIGEMVVDATTAKAIALGDLRVVEKVKLELELSQLQRQHRLWRAESARARFELESMPRQVAERESAVGDIRALVAHRDAHQLRSFTAILRPLVGGDDPESWRTVTDRAQADQRVHALADSLRHKLGEGVRVGSYRGLDLALTMDGKNTCLTARLPGGTAKVSARGLEARGVGAFTQLESQLASLESQLHRLEAAARVTAARLASLRAAAPSWPHAERATALLARYEELCDAVATNGVVDRQRFSFPAGEARS